MFHRPKSALVLTFIFAALAISGCTKITSPTNPASATSTISPANTVHVNANGVISIYDPYSDADLWIVGSTSTTWTQAEAEAKTLGGHLITIHSVEENQFVSTKMFADLTGLGGPDLRSAYAAWTGLYDPTGLENDDGHDSKHASNFVWVDGDAASYRNWNAGEPNNGFFMGMQGSNEYYSSMYGPAATSVNLSNGGTPAPQGTWNDIPDQFAIANLGTTGMYGIAAVPRHTKATHQ